MKLSTLQLATPYGGMLALTNRQQTKQPESFMDTCLAPEIDGVEGTQRAQCCVEVADTLVDWSCFHCLEPCGPCTACWSYPGIGNENEDVCGGDERAHAEEADKLCLHQMRHE